MNIKEKIKRLISTWNPLAVSRRSQMRRRLKNTAPTFLCPNCIGGILFHDLGLQFRSPTVNTMMLQTDFIKFVLNLDDYLEKDLIFFQHPDYDCPCARLGDIIVHFNHYKTQQEAAQKWSARSQRIDRDNLFVFLEERDGLTLEQMESLSKLKARGLVIFTANSYPDIPYALQIPKYQPDGEVGNILIKSFWNDSREYERYFDFVEWFNHADGGNFDIEPFAR